MFALLKRLTNLGVVSSTMRKPRAYPNVSQGFARDRRNLCKSCNEVVGGFNRNLRKYGKEYAN
ncbi:hypothetical protein [Lonepinella sp. BR2357]|uniref:hypothetical protein n=1 Tax=Lonepinella sp. BR2357 TaxID=3434549 RepID=UPI003F6E0BF6